MLLPFQMQMRIERAAWNFQIAATHVLKLCYIYINIYLCACETMFPGGWRFELFVIGAAAVFCCCPSQATLITFGSCNKLERLDSSALLFASIASTKSDVFIWLGDSIYTDQKYAPYSFRAADIESVRLQFKNWKESNANANLEASSNLLMGVWDDHDFGINDGGAAAALNTAAVPAAAVDEMFMLLMLPKTGGAEHPFKAATQQLFLDFLDVPSDSPRRKRKGVYSSEVIGEVGQRVRIILLDARFNRDPIGSNGDLLGAEQWLWLERELQSEVKADMTIIGSGIQVLNDWRPSENWGRFPSERARLLRLLSDSNATGVLFISGDVHFAELTEIKCDGEFKLIDFTSSGLSHCFDEEVHPFVRPLVQSPNPPPSLLVMPLHSHRTHRSWASASFIVLPLLLSHFLDFLG
jgi:alkaline phosphatase D